MKENLMMARIRDAEHSQYVAELKQRISLLELKVSFALKNGVFWDVTLCGSCKNRRFAGT
jgi:hypothetical protein